MNNLETQSWAEIVNEYFFSHSGYVNHYAPILSDAVMDGSSKAQAHQGIALVSSLTVLASIVQGFIEVEKISGKIIPTNVYGIVVSPSGDRKSTVGNEYVAPLEEVEEEWLSKYKEQYSKYEDYKYIYDIKLKSKENEFKRLYSAGKCPEKVQEELVGLRNEEPRKPANPNFLLGSNTGASFRNALSEGMANKFVYSAEGGGIFKTLLAPSSYNFSSLWSGETVKESTITHGDIILKGNRVSLLIMLQPDVFSKIVRNKKSEIEGGGFMARLLYVRPPSLQGYRLFSQGARDDSGLKKFRDWVVQWSNKLYEKFEERCEKEREVWQLDHEATELVVWLSESIEIELRPGGTYSRVSDHGSKLIDNICRVAAIIQFVEVGQGPINFGSTWASAYIVLWMSGFYVNDFSPVSKSEKNAQILHDWLNRKITCYGIRFVKKNHIRQYGPNCIRDNEDLGLALQHLVSHNVVALLYDGSMQVIDCHPNIPFFIEKYSTDVLGVGASCIESNNFKIQEE